MRETQKKKAFEDMQVQLEIKQQKKKDEEELKKYQNQRYLAYIKELDGREEAIKKVKAEKEEAKNKIFEKLKQEEERKRKEAEEI